MNQEQTLEGYIVKTAGNDRARMKLENECVALNLLNGTVSTKFPKVISYTRSNGEWILVRTKLPGVPLADIWEPLTAVRKRKYLQEIVFLMKQIHLVTGKRYGKVGLTSSLAFDNWKEYIAAATCKDIERAEEVRTLNEKEGALVRKFFKSNLGCLTSNKPYLIHHDLKLDNVLVNNGAVSGVVDFEYATYGPIDFELDAMAMSFRKPELYFKEKHLTLNTDSNLLWMVLREAYPEIVSAPFLEKRLSIYHAKFLISLIAQKKQTLRCKQQLIKLCIRGIL